MKQSELFVMRVDKDLVAAPLPKPEPKFDGRKWLRELRARAPKSDAFIRCGAMPK